MRPEYDLRGGPGQELRAGRPEANVVLLKPDVARWFRDSATVNEALRRYVSDQWPPACAEEAGEVTTSHADDSAADDERPRCEQGGSGRARSSIPANPVAHRCAVLWLTPRRQTTVDCHPPKAGPRPRTGPPGATQFAAETVLDQGRQRRSRCGRPLRRGNDEVVRQLDGDLHAPSENTA